jgi:predicted DNA-binding WGR domain protein
MLEKVFIVVKSIAYEGDTVMRVFANYKNAVKYAEELAAADTSEGYFEYDVFEREIY